MFFFENYICNYLNIPQTIRSLTLSSRLGGLGKGFDAIFLDNNSEDSNYFYMKISNIEPNKEQPRKDFNLENLNDLADSIKNYGVLQPLLVRPISGTDSYGIIAGERRWRAARIAGLTEVPVIVREFTEKEQAQIALVENLQREDLSPLEEAFGYKSLIETYSLTQEEVSKSVGKSRSAITNSLRLLSLPKKIQEILSKGDITVGHARTLLSLNSEDQMIKVCNIVIEKKLSVRELESLCKKLNSDSRQQLKKRLKVKDSFLEDVEVSLKRSLGRNVTILSKSANKGILQLEFYNNEDLMSLVKSFGV